LSGRLTATRADEWIVLDFPAEPAAQVEPPEILARAIDAKPVYVGKNRFDYILELESAQTVRNLQPDYAAIGRLPARGVIVTARDDSGKFDFVSRFFAPVCGVDEDPVCGSAHCCLGPHWAQRLDKPKLLGHQVSPRGGVIRVELAGDRVRLGGQAITVLRGELLYG
jgi:predicted PhzF superfamily epimerase YddE/YHI9